MTIAAPFAPPSGPTRAAVERALAEDLGWGDITTDTLVSPELEAEARIVARAAGVVAGLPVAREAFRQVDAGAGRAAGAAGVAFESEAADGDRVEPGDVIAYVRGGARPILSAERVALNFLQRLSGIATLTARYVEAVGGARARIVDTRKTTPGLRALEKYAVRCGGGHNHRMHLGDSVLIKDNHRAALAAVGARLTDAIHRARHGLSHTVAIAVELDSPDALDDVVEAGADAVLLDNMAPAALADAVARVGGRALVEASGGITLDTVREVAESGVDLISVGALTHSAPALDLALDFAI
ncbi:MAG: carboxylating nicotinate-nucleotide diphosphorylase [Gemmatimonadota bacterium]